MQISSAIAQLRTWPHQYQHDYLQQTLMLSARAGLEPSTDPSLL